MGEFTTSILLKYSFMVIINPVYKLSSWAVSVNPQLQPIRFSDCLRPEHIHYQLYNFWSHFEKLPGTVVSITCKLFVFLDRAKVLHTFFLSGIASLWLSLSQVSLLYWYKENTVLRFVPYILVFIHLILLLRSIYPALTQQDNQQHHFLSDIHCHEWVYYIDTTKLRFYGSCDIFWFLFNSF